MTRERDRQAAAAYITPEIVRQTILEMVDIRSPTGSEAAMADYVVHRLRGAGIAASLQLVEDNRPNAIGHLPGRGDGLNLLFTGHMDTSYSGDEEHLHGEGFRPKGIFRDGWIWGLGASNMKSGLAGLLVAIEAVAKSGIELNGDVSLGAVVGEIEKAPVEEFQGPSTPVTGSARNISSRTASRPTTPCWPSPRACASAPPTWVACGRA